RSRRRDGLPGGRDTEDADHRAQRYTDVVVQPGVAVADLEEPCGRMRDLVPEYAEARGQRHDARSEKLDDLDADPNPFAGPYAVDSDRATRTVEPLHVDLRAQRAHVGDLPVVAVRRPDGERLPECNRPDRIVGRSERRQCPLRAEPPHQVQPWGTSPVADSNEYTKARPNTVTSVAWIAG